MSTTTVGNAEWCCDSRLFACRSGDRRRLANTLRGLANRGGFPPPLDGQPGALGWNADRVTQWLREDGLGDLAARFAEHGIDGECLLKLQPDDLKVLGATTLGQQSNLKRRLDRLRKLTYAGQMVGPEAAAAALAAVGEAGAQIRTVLAAVLDDNAALQDRIQQLQDRPAAAAIPDQFQCPILGDLMHDPVIAMDGHTVSGQELKLRCFWPTSTCTPASEPTADNFASASTLTSPLAVRTSRHRNLVPAIRPEPDDQPPHPTNTDPEHRHSAADCRARRRGGGGQLRPFQPTSPHAFHCIRAYCVNQSSVPYIRIPPPSDQPWKLVTRFAVVTPPVSCAPQQ